ncbi:palmitoyl-(protein) hydrolase [Aureococcus anophagefferens]|nr:palmitoyl-(protein) hydrolase [Aureococcus anophagefferens]
MWAVLLMAAAAAGLLATEGRTAQQIEAVAAALLAVDDLNAAYASDNITFTLAAAWGDYDVDVVEASTNATAGGFVVLARPPPCDVGTAWNGTACEACPPGFTRVEGDACAPCAPGSFSDDRLLCEPCDEYSYQPAFAAASCLACPANAKRVSQRGLVVGDGSSVDQCLCEAGFYSTAPLPNATAFDDAWGAPGVACAACPEGAVCRGYAYAPYNEKNYWADPANPAVVQECYNDGQCKRKFRCFEAYEGRALVLAECELFDILLSYVQTVAIISSFHISWPKHARYLFVFFSLLLFDVDAVAPNCLVRWTNRHAYAAQYGLCLVGTLKWYKVGGLLAAKLWREPEARSFRGVRDAFRFETGDLSDVAVDALVTSLTVLDLQHFILTYNFFSARPGVPFFLSSSATRVPASQIFKCSDGDVDGVASYVLSMPDIRCDPAVLARFGWSFERFRSPLHFWYIVLKWRSILICAITTLDDGAVQLFCGSRSSPVWIPNLQPDFNVIAVEQTLSLLFRPYEKTLLNGVDTAGFVLVAAFASSTIVLFSDEAHRFKQTWLVSVVAFVVAAFGAVAVHEVLAKRDRLFKQAATQETKRRFRVDDHRGILSKRLSELQHRVNYPGVIDFVVEELTHVERTIYFGCMLRLERFLQKDGHTRLHDLIEEADRSSILYFLLSASKADADKLVTDLATPGGVSSSLAAVQDQVSGHANEHHAKQHKTTVEDCEKVEVRAVLLSHVVTKKDADDEAPVVVVDDEMPEALGEVAVEVARRESRRALVPYPESLGAFFCASRDDPVVGIYACGD